MKNFFSQYKFDIIWLLVTLVIIVSINISYMYSRDRTLSTVEKNEFKLFINLMHSTSLNHRNFLSISKALTIPKDKTKQALFHIALVTSNECIENGKHSRNKPFLCDLFPNAKAISTILEDQKKTYYFNGHKRDIIEFSTKKLGIHDPRYNALLIKKRIHTNKWIVAKKRYFRRDSAFKKFSFFVKKRYLQTTSIFSKYRTTKASVFIIFGISLFLWLFFKSRERKNSREYSILMKKSKDLNSEIIILDNKYNHLKNNIFILEEEIRDEEILLTSSECKDATNKRDIIENIRKKTIQQTQLSHSLAELKNKIMQLEADINAIEPLLDNKRIKLQNFERNVEYTKISQSTIAVRQLWRHEPTWIKRKQIETTVALTQNNLPFTITQAFLSFEQHVDQEIKQCLDGAEQEEALDKTLIKKISIISQYKNPPMSEETLTLYHNVRKARNKWVHGAIYPDKELLDNLLSILEATDITPHL